ncbi:hypothetical protein V8E36_004714 [Tilletia maclaganii]
MQKSPAKQAALKRRAEATSKLNRLRSANNNGGKDTALLAAPSLPIPTFLSEELPVPSSSASAGPAADTLPTFCSSSNALPLPIPNMFTPSPSIQEDDGPLRGRKKVRRTQIGRNSKSSLDECATASIARPRSILSPVADPLHDDTYREGAAGHAPPEESNRCTSGLNLIEEPESVPDHGAGILYDDFDSWWSPPQQDASPLDKITAYAEMLF